MKPILGSLVMIEIMLSCTPVTKPETELTPSIPIIGTWKLISGATIVKNDTSLTDYTMNQSMIKIINGTHFAFLKHDLKNGKDSAMYGSGGGTYTLTGNQYTEHLDYCDAREWEGHTFSFTVSVVNDTLIQTGIEKLENLGIDRVIIEKYKLVKD